MNGCDKSVMWVLNIAENRERCIDLLVRYNWTGCWKLADGTLIFHRWVDKDDWEAFWPRLSDAPSFGDGDTIRRVVSHAQQYHQPIEIVPGLSREWAEALLDTAANWTIGAHTRHELHWTGHLPQNEPSYLVTLLVPGTYWLLHCNIGTTDTVEVAGIASWFSQQEGVVGIAIEERGDLWKLIVVSVTDQLFQMKPRQILSGIVMIRITEPLWVSIEYFRKQVVYMPNREATTVMAVDLSYVKPGEKGNILV